jgi:hypothetical protein
MDNDKHHVIILPYYCQDEIRRYLKIASHLKSYPRPGVSHSYVLAASPLAEPSEALRAVFSQLGPTRAFQCPTKIYGYPEGPTAMYWDAMEFVATEFAGSSGFSLWFESDMCPVKPDWLDRLSAEWYSTPQVPLMMGCYVPEVFKYRFFREPKLILDPHINGGACYSIDFVNKMPAEAREGVFDMAVFGYAKLAGYVQKTEQISFSSTRRVRRDVLDESKVILHGFMQDKDKFIDSCVRPITPEERRMANWSAWQDQIESLQRRVRVRFVRKGHRAMLENMLLAKEKFEAAKQAKIRPKQHAA